MEDELEDDLNGYDPEVEPLDQEDPEYDSSNVTNQSGWYNAEQAKFNSLYDSIKSSENMLEATSNILYLTNTDLNIAKHKANKLFNKVNRSTAAVRYTIDTRSNEIDSREMQSISLVTESLNNYLKSISGVRYEDAKVRSLAVFLLREELEGYLPKLVLPDNIRELVDSYYTINTNSVKSLIQSAKDRFISYNVPELTKFVITMDRSMLDQKSDLVINQMHHYHPMSQEDKDYLQDLRTQFLRSTDQPNQQDLYDFFDLSDSSYRRHLQSMMEYMQGDSNSEIINRLNEVLNY